MSRIDEIKERRRDNFRELGNDEWRYQYRADIDYLLSCIEGRGVEDEVIAAAKAWRFCDNKPVERFDFPEDARLARAVDALNASTTPTLGGERCAECGHSDRTGGVGDGRCRQLVWNGAGSRVRCSCKCVFPAPPEAGSKATPLCPVHQRLEDSNNLECEIGGNDCAACSLNERAELLKLLAPFAAKDGSEDSLTVMRRVTDFYETHQGENRVVVSYPAPSEIEQCGAFKPSVLGVPEPQDRCVSRAGHEGKHTLNKAAPTPIPAEAAARHRGFCGKTDHEVPVLIQAPVGFICNECVTICADIIQKNKPSTATSAAVKAAREHATAIVGTVFENTAISHETLEAVMIERITDYVATYLSPTEAAVPAGEVLLSRDEAVAYLESIGAQSDEQRVLLAQFLATQPSVAQIHLCTSLVVERDSTARANAIDEAIGIARCMAAGETFETGRQKALNIAAALEALKQNDQKSTPTGLS